MPKYLELNKEHCTFEELTTCQNCAPSREGFKAFEGIRYLYRGYSIKEVAELKEVTARTVRNWIHKFNREGLDLFTIKGKSGRPRKIPIDKFKAEYLPIILNPKLVGEDYFTAIKFHGHLKREHKEELCYQTLLNYFHENSLSLVIPRPCVEGKQCPEKRSEFVRQFHELHKENKEFWFCDEVGFEGDPRPRSRWVKTGSKPVQGRASEHIRFSAVGAVNPLSGEMLSLVVPSSNQEVFQVYLNQLNKNTNGRHIHLILDNASWHKAKCLQWYNIKPVYLPPYSPDFNPIENLWRYLKINFFRNWYAKNVEELIEKICIALNSLTHSQIKQTANSDYLLKK